MSIPGQTTEVVVAVMGVAVGIPVDGVHVERLRHQWGRALTSRPAEVTVDTTSLSDDEIASDYALTSLVTMAALRSTAGRRLNMHAGAVADATGRALGVILSLIHI